MKGVMGPKLSPSAWSPRSSSRSDMAGTGGHQQEGTESLSPVELTSSSVSQRLATSLSRDTSSSFREGESGSPGSGSRGGLWAGLPTGMDSGVGEASGEVRVKDRRWVFSSASLSAMAARCTGCGVPGDLGILWEDRISGRSPCSALGNDPAPEEVCRAGSSVPEASIAVTKDASELQSHWPGGDSKPLSLSAISGWTRRLSSNLRLDNLRLDSLGLASRHMFLPSLLPTAVEPGVTQGGAERLVSSPFPQGSGPEVRDESEGQTGGVKRARARDGGWIRQEEAAGVAGRRESRRQTACGRHRM